MDKKLLIPIGIAAGIAILLAVLASEIGTEMMVMPQPETAITQEELRIMIDEWMEWRKTADTSIPEIDKMDVEKRIIIMEKWELFQESGQKLSDDQDGHAMWNQITKMVGRDLQRD